MQMQPCRGVARWLCGCCLLALLLAHADSLLSLLALPRGEPPPRPSAAPCNITRAAVIALRPADGERVARGVRGALAIDNVTVLPAVNGSALVGTAAEEALPLYTRQLLRGGRHDHMQISTPGMLGCLLSHAEVWRGVQPGEVVAVFEEDAVLDAASADRLWALDADLRGVPWDVLLLESGHLNVDRGGWRPVGTYAATCAAPPCAWFGTRGYAVTHAGAATLLLHAAPPIVQVDAVMVLAAAFVPGFRMYWTRADVAHQDPAHSSTVWDGCLKCYVPTSPWFFAGVAVAWPISVAGAAYAAGRRGGASR